MTTDINWNSMFLQTLSYKLHGMRFTRNCSRQVGQAQVPVTRKNNGQG